MSADKLSFHHIHIISEDPRASAKWYEDILGATIRDERELRSAPQINVGLGGRAKGATFVVEPWEFSPGGLICYLAAPDGVSIELVQARQD
jgi:catechol 2,3-dioxygenase-like lactoylglutathione lyase family enzyme